jgi:hypothetical protein
MSMQGGILLISKPLNFAGKGVSKSWGRIQAQASNASPAGQSPDLVGIQAGLRPNNDVYRPSIGAARRFGFSDMQVY